MAENPGLTCDSIDSRSTQSWATSLRSPSTCSSPTARTIDSIAPDGSLEWLCLPRPDSPSVFGALLDRAAGSFRFGPSNTMVPHQRRYVPGTMVVETTWHTPSGWLVAGRTSWSCERWATARGAQGIAELRPFCRCPALGSRSAKCISGKVEVGGDLCTAVRLRGLHRKVVLRRRRVWLGHRLSDSRSASCRSRSSAVSDSAQVAGSRCRYGRTSLSVDEESFIALSWGEALDPRDSG